ncbi:Hpt domain-containing protein [Aeromonas hydrophila]|nr:Hpt domain-containing protein [Aeromonas hydrophila]
MMALMTRNMTSTRLCLRLISERVSSTRVRCSINVIARASCMETRLDHRRSACSNFINKVRSRPGLLQAAFGSSLETMLVSFRQDLEQSLGLSHEDDKALADWVHRQAGTIAMMRIDEVAEQAWHLEEQIRNDGRARCEVELTKFRDVLQQLVDELAALSRDCRQPAVVL